MINKTANIYIQLYSPRMVDKKRKKEKQNNMYRIKNWTMT